MSETNQPHSALAAAFMRQQQPVPAAHNQNNYNVYDVINSLSYNPRDRFYKNQDIYLDGFTFTNCAFSNCRFISETGIFVLRSCLVMNDCQYFYGQAALRIIKLFNLQYPNPNAHPAYNVVRELHGTVTLE
jgi:hypothetical protein